ncbi:MAG: hypothetical protein GMKNLPBB_01146 [Myxococcota bacterium]|nr:hypothetical protein [Myxococcota bacterium]
MKFPRPSAAWLACAILLAVACSSSGEADPQKDRDAAIRDASPSQDAGAAPAADSGTPADSSANDLNGWGPLDDGSQSDAPDSMEDAGAATDIATDGAAPPDAADAGGPGDSTPADSGPVSAKCQGLGGKSTLTAVDAVKATAAGLVFSARKDEKAKTDLYLIAPDGSGLKNLSNTADKDETSAQFIEGGKTLLFSDSNNLGGFFITPLNQFTPVRIRGSRGGNARLSPDGKRVAFIDTVSFRDAAQSDELFVADFDPAGMMIANPKLITPDGDDQDDPVIGKPAHVAWLPDSSAPAAAIFRVELEGRWMNDILVIKDSSSYQFITRRTAFLTDRTLYHGAFAFAPDGRRVLYFLTEEGGSNAGYFLIPDWTARSDNERRQENGCRVLTGRPQRKDGLLRGADYNTATINRDGRFFAAAVDEGVIVILDANGGEVTRFDTGLKSVSGLTWD